MSDYSTINFGYIPSEDGEIASYLRNTNGLVEILNSGPPVAGHVLQATSGTEASWQSLSTVLGLENTLAISNTTGPHDIVMTDDSVLTFPLLTSVRSIRIGDALSYDPLNQGNIILVGRNISMGAVALNSIGIGRQLSSSSNNNIIMGVSNTISTTSDASIIVGNTITMAAGCSSSIALGINLALPANASGSLAIGGSQTWSGVCNNSQRIGGGGTMAGAFSTSIGNSNSVSSDQCVSIGYNSSISTGAAGGILLGPNSSIAASQSNGICFGNGATISAGSVNATNAIRIGVGGICRMPGAIIIGNGAQSGTVGGGAVGIGTNVQATGTNSCSISAANSIASGQDSIALGNTSTASALSAMALGPNSTAQSSGSIAMGKTANASGGNNLAAGINANVTASEGVGLGASASVTATSGVALGANSSASAGSATALGKLAVAAHASSTALGTGATTTAINQIMCGTSSTTVEVPGFLSECRAQGFRDPVNNTRVLEFTGAAAVTDYFNMQSGTGTVALRVDPASASTNVNLGLTPKGTGDVLFNTAVLKRAYGTGFVQSLVQEGGGVSRVIASGPQIIARGSGTVTVVTPDALGSDSYSGVVYNDTANNRVNLAGDRTYHITAWGRCVFDGTSFPAGTNSLLTFRLMYYNGVSPNYICTHSFYAHAVDDLLSFNLSMIFRIPAGAGQYVYVDLQNFSAPNADNDLSINEMTLQCVMVT